MAGDEFEAHYRQRALEFTPRPEVEHAMRSLAPPGWMGNHARDLTQHLEILGVYHLRSRGHDEPAIVGRTTRTADPHTARPERTFYLALWLDDSGFQVTASERLDESRYRGDASGEPSVLNGDHPLRRPRPAAQAPSSSSSS